MPNSSIVIRVTKGLNSFAGAGADRLFTAYAGASTPSVADTTKPWITVRETDLEEIAETSDTSDALWESYVELYISGKDPSTVAAAQHAIIARRRQIIGAAGEQFHYYINERETVADGREGRYEEVLELRVLWTEDYTTQGG